MGEEQEKIFSETEPNIHCMTLPRELSLCGKKLCQRPIRELYGLLGQNIAAVRKDTEWKAVLKKRTFFMRIQEMDEKQDFSILFHRGEAELEYSSKEKKLSFSRRNWVDHSMEVRTTVVDALEELEIWSDQSSMEIFVNDGQTVFSSRIFPESDELEITAKGFMKDTEIQVCEIDKEEKNHE